MQGYDASTYGEAFADVYDEWYADVSDVETTVDALAAIARDVGATAILELGVGTGRLAIPLAERLHPATVVGIDASTAMLERLRAKQSGNDVQVTANHGDMAADLPDGPFGVVFVAFNTFFNLSSHVDQQRCFVEVAARLATNGCFVIEAIVPDEPARTGSHVEVRTIAADRVVLSVARYDGANRSVEGQFVEFTEGGGVRLRPWSIRSVPPAELDEMAALAGLVLRDRWETFAGEAYSADSPRHVSVYVADPAIPGTVVLPASPGT